MSDPCRIVIMWPTRTLLLRRLHRRLKGFDRPMATSDGTPPKPVAECSDTGSQHYAFYVRSMYQVMAIILSDVSSGWKMIDPRLTLPDNLLKTFLWTISPSCTTFKMSILPYPSILKLPVDYLLKFLEYITVYTPIRSKWFSSRLSIIQSAYLPISTRTALSYQKKTRKIYIPVCCSCVKLQSHSTSRKVWLKFVTARKRAIPSISVKKSAL